MEEKVTLSEVINDRLIEFNEIGVEQEEFQKEANVIVALQNAETNHFKVISESDNKVSALELEEKRLELEEKRLEFDNKKLEVDNRNKEEDRKLERMKIGVGVGTTLATIGTYVWSTLKGFKFEEVGSITSTTMRSIFQKVNPFKK